MKRLLLCSVLAALGQTAHSQELKPYLAMRKQFGITHAAGVEALETLVGKRTLEVRGVVKGTFRVGNVSSLLLERTDGDTYVVDSNNIPQWLVGSQIPARLIVSAARTAESGELRTTLLSACSDDLVTRYERSLKPPTLAVTAPSTRHSNGFNVPQPKSSGPRWILPASEVTPIYASFIRQRNRRLTPSQALGIAQGIVGFSLQYAVDARLIMAMVMVESGFNPSARSRAGAMGLGQLMPGTALGMGVGNAYDSIENLYGTVKLIRGHLDGYKRRTGDDFQSMVLALAAYNAGPNAVARHGGVPPYRETRNYVRKVIGVYYAFLGRS